MTHCNLEGPRASTLLCVKWGCQHLPLRARIHSRKLSIKLKLTLLYAENKPLLFHYTMATVFPGSNACDILFHPPIHLSSSRQTKAQTPFSRSHITRASRPRAIFVEDQRKQSSQQKLCSSFEGQAAIVLKLLHWTDDVIFLINNSGIIRPPLCGILALSLASWSLCEDSGTREPSLPAA